MNRQQLKDALAWQIAIGADVALLDHPPAEKTPIPVSKWMQSAPAIDRPILQVEEGVAPMPSASSDVSVSAKQAAPNAQAGPASSDLSGDHLKGAPSELRHIETLEGLKNALQAFEGCALKQTASNLVFSDGNPDADIMLIGEAPGRDEDRVGLPFVGAAGQLLDKMLRSIGLDRTQVYICNILPWRPPGNRTPTVEETQMLWPFLQRHIQLKSPRIIMALGGSSAKLLLDETTGILKLRGRIVERDFGLSAPVPVLPSLHPAYLLRSPGQKRLSYQDLLTLQNYIGGKT